MAKKAAVTADGKTLWFDKKPAKGPYKQCPECSCFIHAKKNPCPKCGHSFPTPTNGKPRRKGREKLDPLTVIEKMKALGGFGEVQKALAKIAMLQNKVNEAENQLADLGGKEGAEKAVELMTTLQEALK